MRGAAVLLAVMVAIAAAMAPAATGAPDGGEATSTAAKKKCKKGKARFRGRCVKRCPSGYVKKRSARGRVCARKPRQQQPQPQLPPQPGGQPLFQAPAQELTGTDAFNHFSRYFLDSRFTDCPAGWPSCAVEQRYNNCPTGGWEYHRLTPTSGSDINSYGSYQVTGAAAHTDGSWGVEYVVTAYGVQTFYSWDVHADGTVVGRYWAPGSGPPSPPSEQIGPLRWQQPAGCS